jgi:hypothetical protein
MGQIVKCDICGKIYNQRHLSSHQRLAHGKRISSFHSSKNEEASVGTILSLYEKLPEELKKEVLNRLAAGVEAKA